MYDILKEIVKIDTLAFDNQSSKNSQIEERKAYYKTQIETYRLETLQKANLQADEIYTEIVKVGQEQFKLQKEKSKQNILKFENRYLQVKDRLLEQVFEELFITED